MILLDNCMPHRYQRLLQEWGYDTELDAALLTDDLDFSNILVFDHRKC
jgi:hypothetical protein